MRKQKQGRTGQVNKKHPSELCVNKKHPSEEDNPWGLAAGEL